MTEKLFYKETYLSECQAKIVKISEIDTGFEVVLNQTIFYPEGGGQPADTGYIDGKKVLDVYTKDNEVIHLVGQKPSGEIVKCQLNWHRRFDHMQQHAGQHVLSAACEKLYDAETVGFHLSSEYTTIDLNIDNLTWEQIKEIEQEASRIVLESLPIKVHWVQPEELHKFPLRKAPKVNENIRIVEIDGYDFSPCGGTHPKHTAEIGLIKIVRTEKVRKNVRLVFVCGERALRDYQTKTKTAKRLVEILNVPEDNIVEAAERLVQQNQEQSKSLHKLQEEMLDYVAKDLHEQAEEYHGVKVITNVYEEYDISQIRVLAAKLAANPKTVAMLAAKGDKAQFVFSRSQDVNVHMGQILKNALAAIGGRGGGRPDNAQGGTGTTEGIEKAMGIGLAEVREQLARN